MYLDILYNTYKCINYNYSTYTLFYLTNIVICFILFVFGVPIARYYVNAVCCFFLCSVVVVINVLFVLKQTNERKEMLSYMFGDLAYRMIPLVGL